MEKAVDCLRIVTTGNDANKRALVEIPIAVPALVSLLSDDPSQVCWVHSACFPASCSLACVDCQASAQPPV